MSARSLNGAYAHYLGLGAGRSYRAVARHFGASVRAVTKRAAREGWRDRLARHEARVREVTDDRLLKAEIARRRRLLMKLGKVQARALKALQDHPLRSAMEAVEVLVTAIELERVIHGVLCMETARVAGSKPHGPARAPRRKAIGRVRRE